MTERLLLTDSGILHSHRATGICSYDHTGCLFAWEPPADVRIARAAIDVEAREQASATAMANRFELCSDEFLARWTATEALAKVLDEPILSFLRREGLCPAASCEWQRTQFGAWLRTLEHPTHCITAAVILREPS